MKAILIDISNEDKMLQHSSPFNSLTLPVINKPLISWQIEKLKMSGIDEILVITGQKIPKELRDGKRWNTALQYRERLTPDMLSAWKNDTDLLIMQANRITNLDIVEFIRRHRENHSNCSAAHSVSANADICNPLIIRASLIKEILAQNTNTAVDSFFLKTTAKTVASHIFNFDFDIYLLKSYSDYWQLHKNLLAENPETLSLSGFPLNSNMWIDVDTRVHSDVSVEGIAIIGKNSRLHKEVKLQGFVIIGDDVVIDSRTQIENSVIMNNTYIGSDILIKDSVVKQNFLYQTNKNLGMHIEEEFIIGRTDGRVLFFSGLLKRKLRI